jgi:uncharacterized membrane protein YccC
MAVRGLRNEIAAATPDLAAMQAEPRLILVRNTLARLDDVISLQGRIRRLRDRVLAGRRIGRSSRARSVRYREPALALVAGSIAAASVLVAAAFWIESAWPNGGSAVIFTGVVCSIMGALDDPAAAARNFLRMTALSAVLAAVALFGVLPLLDDFASLAAVLALFYVPFGMIMAQPRIGAAVLPLGLNFTALLGISNTTPPTDFATFANSALALLVGIGIGVLMFRLLRPIGVAWAVERIHVAILRDLAGLARARRGQTRNRFEATMFDRINALFGRLDPARPEQRGTLQGALASLRIGMNLLALRRAAAALPDDQASLIREALASLGSHLNGLARGRRDSLPLIPFTRAAAALSDHGEGSDARTALTTLTAIRATLDAHADFFSAQRSPLAPEILLEAAP